MLFAALLLSGCTRGDQTREAVPVDKLFSQLPASYTGITFENRLTDTEAFNVFTYRNYYNGGGVGIADLNGDGLADVFFTANQGPNRLYLNQGDFLFKDVTDAAGVRGTRAWSTGVSIADVNGDGLLDLYVCNAGLQHGDRANELFINNGPGADGVPTFAEAAADYGLADEGYGVHASFFDYDRDGDLDLYLLNNSPRPVSSFGPRNIRHERHAWGGDKLFRNDGGHFTDVSEEAGIYGSEIGLGLSVTTGDVDRDGWIDLYVANDFFERDYLYRNRGDGTFEEVAESRMRHLSLSSMGADMGDVNNDGYPELYVTDMLPEHDRRLKTTATYESWDLYQANVANGYHHQYMRNMLHLNNADGTFSEIGQIAGVAATDWSWAALLADFDLDGFKDIFVSNGVYRDVIDQDFVAFFTGVVREMGTSGKKPYSFLELVERMPSTPLSNYLFANDGDPGSSPGQAPGSGSGQALTFTDRSSEWGLDAPGFSNGAAYGDLDNDGDLDLVVNNINHEAFIYRNEADTLLGHRYLQIKLVGEGKNTFGIGAKVTLRHGGQQVYLEQIPMRGFQSSVDYVLTAGLGRIDTVEAAVVEWPDGRVEVRTGVPANRLLTFYQREAAPAGTEWKEQPVPVRPLFEDASGAAGLDYVHRENDFVDFDRESLLPKMLSTEGPYLAVGDVDGDGLDDVFIGGAKGSPGRLYVQQRGGGFTATNEALFAADRSAEDLGAAFFDADGDGDQDLYVVSGGSEFSEMAPALRDRLYLNDGRGRFEKTTDRLPFLFASGSRVAPADYDGDGDTDLFVGARLRPWRYGYDPQSVLLENDGRGRFTDVTAKAAPELAETGMVTDAAWTDYDADGRLDLVLVGEWMPVTLFRNRGGTLERVAAPPGLENSHGLWNRLLADDLDGDGDPDFVVGNLGLNSKLRASRTEPATMHVGDFDRNGYVEQIVSVYQDGKSYPIALRNEIVHRLPFLGKKYPTHAAYAEQAVTDLFTQDQLAEAVVKVAHTFESAVVENLGGGAFRLHALPFEAQLAPVYGILADDFDRDGRKDLLLAGNFHGVGTGIGRMDASYGLLLRGDGAGRFTPVAARESGFRVSGQARDLRYVHRAGGGKLVLVAKNDDRLQVFRKL